MQESTTTTTIERMGLGDIPAGVKVPAIGSRFWCPGKYLDSGYVSHDSGDGKPKRARCSGCGRRAESFTVSPGVWVVIDCREHMNTPIGQIPADRVVKAVRTEKQALAFIAKQEDDGYGFHARSVDA